LLGTWKKWPRFGKTLDSRYDDLESNRVKPIDREDAFRKLRETSERRRSDG
jgi:hypothetical protein